MSRRSTKNRRKNKDTAVRYRDELWRMGAAITTTAIACSGIYFLAKPEVLSLNVLSGLGTIYFCLTYLALLWIRFCTVLLDKLIPWAANRYSRASLQLFAGSVLTLVMVYGLSWVVFSIPALKVPIPEDRQDEYHQGGILLTIFVSLISNLYYICSYLLAVCYRILAKARKMLRQLQVLRSKLADRMLELGKLNVKVQEQALELERKDAELEHKIALETGRKLREFLSERIEQEQPLAETPVPTYKFEVGGEETEVPYPEIVKFTFLVRTVFIYWLDTDKKVQNRAVKAASLKAVGRETNHYFRKATRNMLISQDMIKDCEDLGNGQYQLILKAGDEKVPLSEDTSRELRPWIEEAVKIKRKPPAVII